MSDSKRPQPPGRLRLLASTLSLAASAVCFWLWYAHYLRIDFNAQGRFHDADAGVVYTDAAFVWGFAAFGFLALMMLCQRRRRPRD